MNYPQALAFVLSLPDWERGTGRTVPRQELLVERPAALLDALGNPQTRFRSVLVAGTKGKGSTAAMLASIAQAAGYKTGLYTSPHLHTYRERIQIQGEPVSQDEFALGAGEVRTVSGEVLGANPEFDSFSTFEVMTVLALRYFARQHIDIAILEVGLGGRLDATNAVEADLALITPISFDHMAVLGDTLPKIAYEKAGIIKPDKIVLCAPQHPEALAVIRDVAREKNAALAVGERDWIWLGGHSDLQVEGVPCPRVWQEDWQVRNLRVPLLGVHQLANAGLAAAAAKVMQEDWGLKIREPEIRQGLASTRWRGRLEILRQGDATGAAVVTDGAHNGDSAKKLVAALKFHFEFDKLFLIFGALRDKNLDALVAPFVPLTGRAWTVETKHPRSWDADALAQELNGRGVAANAAPDMQTALSEAQSYASPRDLICIIGSLSVVAMAREAFGLATESDSARD